MLTAPRKGVLMVTLAPEVVPPGFIAQLVAAGVRVSLGHSAATFEEAQEAIGSGARQATHLFNRMRPMTHRDPGLVGAALASEDLAVEIICDGHHVHPAVMRFAIAAKGPSRTLAITDGLSRWDGRTEQVPCEGHAILFARSIAAVLPPDLDPALAGKTVTGRRLNVNNALQSAAPAGLKVTAATPSGTTSVSSVRLTFNKAVDPLSFTPADVTSRSGSSASASLSLLTRLSRLSRAIPRSNASAPHDRSCAVTA